MIFAINILNAFINLLNEVPTHLHNMILKWPTQLKFL